MNWVTDSRIIKQQKTKQKAKIKIKTKQKQKTTTINQDISYITEFIRIVMFVTRIHISSWKWLHFGVRSVGIFAEIISRQPRNISAIRYTGGWASRAPRGREMLAKAFVLLLAIACVVTGQEQSCQTFDSCQVICGSVKLNLKDSKIGFP